MQMIELASLLLVLHNAACVCVVKAVEATIGFWGKIWVFLTNFVKYLRYM